MHKRVVAFLSTYVFLFFNEAKQTAKKYLLK